MMAIDWGSRPSHCLKGIKLFGSVPKIPSGPLQCGREKEREKGREGRKVVVVVYNHLSEVNWASNWMPEAMPRLTALTAAAVAKSQAKQPEERWAAFTVGIHTGGSDVRCMLVWCQGHSSSSSIHLHLKWLQWYYNNRLSLYLPK